MSSLIPKYLFLSSAIDKLDILTSADVTCLASSFFYGLFNDALDSSDHVESNGGMIGRIAKWK